MSVSVPNLTSTTNTSNLENVNPSLLETFTAIAKRAQGLQISNNSTNIARTNNNCNQSNIAASTVTNNSIFPRAPASVSSLVRLALSSNFPELMSVAFIYREGLGDVVCEISRMLMTLQS
ncbi:hypothetical protein M8J75_013056 [Diaphorina citri]|nr:hypothetical protein M8J75_013056 [Diaphorina citri]KAI5710981.1 hypothetical protein M8J75_013056 [Diaphorina citri]KAI5710982.1 hypothetical protein M8J75_013056 [Diaphorina citri]